MIYSRFGDELTQIRYAALDDVKRLDGRKPTQGDRQAVADRSYVVVTYSDGTEGLSHIGYLRADGGLPEVMAALCDV